MRDAVRLKADTTGIGPPEGGHYNRPQPTAHSPQPTAHGLQPTGKRNQTEW
jgi:hypothetical protein